MRQAQMRGTWKGLKKLRIYLYRINFFLEATEYSPSCIGYRSDTWVLGNHMSEDYLTINVVRLAGLPDGVKLLVAGFLHSAELATEGSINLERVTIWGESSGAFSLFNPLVCLRKSPIKELSAIFNSSFASPPGWGQVVDGDFITASGSSLLQKGKFVKGTEFAPQGINTTAQFTQYVRSVGVSKQAVRTVERLYSNDPTVGIPSTLKSIPERALARLGKQYKRVAAFSGDSWARRHVPNVSPARGAGHFQEVVFVFHNLVQLADVMSTAWISFIVHRNPVSYAQSLTWPEYRDGRERNVVFDVNVTGLAYSEPDTFRQRQIAYIIDNLY
ncbi:Alpha/Beta hydrolase protein [Fusarium solani]|uniref:Alpha/Beta hydrolase protein n=1 Tax=Fusarium solani TaxID=169388 RepID=A0A9P9FZP1_FUSSL|nr:Alpha/Beta hydrolase protein [Fusarium solani]KAH7226025.1 Alpha/Beta hydrolase protein [Fusarium solani]